MSKKATPQKGEIVERSDGRMFITGSSAPCHPKAEMYLGINDKGEQYHVCGECDQPCDAQAVQQEPPKVEEKPKTAVEITERMKKTAELLVYGLDFDSERVTQFVDRMQYFMHEAQGIGELNCVLPADCAMVASADKAAKAFLKEPLPNDPYALADKQRIFIGWKHAMGELEAKYTALSTGKELEYYATRGASFVALTKFGHSLEKNIKEGRTVADRENQSQLLTMPVAKERVYYTWVAKVISNMQWTLMGIIQNIDQYLIEARRERKAAEQPTR